MIQLDFTASVYLIYLYYRLKSLFCTMILLVLKKLWMPKNSDKNRSLEINQTKIKKIKVQAQCCVINIKYHILPDMVWAGRNTVWHWWYMYRWSCTTSRQRPSLWHKILYIRVSWWNRWRTILLSKRFWLKLNSIYLINTFLNLNLLNFSNRIIHLPSIF